MLPGPAAPASPSGPPSGPARKRVSAAGYWIAGVLLVVGTGAALVWFVVTIVAAVNAPNDFDRVAVPGSMEVDLEAGEWTLYHEYPGANQSVFSRPPLDVTVTNPAGGNVQLDFSNVSSTYSNGSHDGTSWATFQATRAGRYEITAFGEPRTGQYVAVGKGIFDGGTVVGLVGSMVLGGLAFLIGLTVLIVTIVRRGRWKRSQAPPRPPYGGPGWPAPSPGAAPDPRWGPPGTGAAHPFPAPPAPPAPAPGPPAWQPPPGPIGNPPPPGPDQAGWAAPGADGGPDQR